MRRASILLTIALGLVATPSADAGWKESWHRFWARVELDRQRNNAWPEPFQSADREAYRAPWAIMVNNGWRLQNTLPDELFDEETQQLSHAGRLKLRDIVTKSPLHRRTVFVLRGDTIDITEARVEEVQQELTQILPQGPLPEVLLTDTAPRPGTGQYYDRVNRSLENTIPSPRLPAMQEAEE